MLKIIVKELRRLIYSAIWTAFMMSCMYCNAYVSKLFVTTACKMSDITPIYLGVGLEVYPCMLLFGIECLLYNKIYYK